MKEYKYSSIEHPFYAGVVTFLDYETSVRKCLSEISVEKFQPGQRVLIDLALLVGMTRFRFTECAISKDGRIGIGSCTSYADPPEELVEKANEFLRGEREIVEHSMLPAAKKKALLEGGDVNPC